MKIIKEINDDAWAREISPELADSATKPNWSWGLGDDGLLYCKGYISVVSQFKWRRYTGYMCIPLTLKKMIQIVNEFQHLIPFI